MSRSHNLENFFVENNAAPPLHLGTRYNSAGTFLSEPGNTVVSHIDPEAPSTAAVLNLREKMMSLPGADRLAFTAASSLHMTIFQGIIEFRRKLPFWPRDLALETPIDDMTALFLDRLAYFQAPATSFEVTVAEITPNGLTMVPVDDDSAETLRQWRDRLANCFGYRHPDHDSYRFHITFAYLTDWLPDDAFPIWEKKTAEWLSELNAAAPVITLKTPAFCSFEDMNHFEELLVLK